MQTRVVLQIASVKSQARRQNTGHPDHANDHHTNPEECPEQLDLARNLQISAFGIPGELRTTISLSVDNPYAISLARISLTD